jgi:threonine dehydrogenase-like Zn-dependent dehydrogenase
MEMKVIHAFGPGDLRVVKAPVPSPAEDEVLLKVRASGICGSDKWIWHVQGHTSNVAGHEIAGEVVEAGKNVTSFSIGDRVLVNNVVGCGNCPACRAGAFVLCEYWDGKKDVNNGYGEYVTAPARNCQVLDKRLSFTEGALLMDNWGTPYGGISRMPIAPGDIVVVFGLGPIGQAAVALLKWRHAYVVGVDPVPFRRKHARAIGADLTLSPGENIIDHVKALGVGAHFVMECSGQMSAYETGLSLLRIGGMFVTIGEEAEYRLRPSENVLRRSLTIQGSWYSTMPQGHELQRLAISGQIQPAAFLTHRIQSLEAVPEIFGGIVSCQDGLLKCVIELAS